MKSVYFAKEVAPKLPTAKQLYEGQDESELSSVSSDAAGEEASGYEDEDASASEPSSAEEDDVDYDSEESERPKKRQKRGNAPRTERAAAVPANTTKGREPWRPGVKTGLGPGIEVIIDAPKARPAGKTPYSDETIRKPEVIQKLN